MDWQHENGNRGIDVEVLRRNFREIDFSLIGILLVIAVYSCVALLAATFGKSGGDVPAHIVTKQVIFEVLGIGVMIVTAAFDYRSLRKVHWWIYGISIFLLIVVFGFHATAGAHSWIPIGSQGLQPSEFAKLGLILSLAAYMADIDESEFPDYSLKRSVPIFVLFLVPFLLVLKEPALGQALVMFAIVITMYVVYAQRSHFLIATSSLLAVIGVVSVIAAGFSQQAADSLVQQQDFLDSHHIMHGYQLDRIISWLDPNYKPLGAGFNVHHAFLAVGSGQVFGEGLFNGAQTRGGWVPNQWTDYIFTAIAEEFGFVGSATLILLFLMLIYRLVKISSTSQDAFGTYVIIGVVGMFAFQVFENVGMNLYMSPSTGITLPFISYGGSSLIANYMAVGLALSVSLRKKKLRFA